MCHNSKSNLPLSHYLHQSVMALLSDLVLPSQTAPIDIHRNEELILLGIQCIKFDKVCCILNENATLYQMWGADFLLTLTIIFHKNTNVAKFERTEASSLQL